MFSRRNGQCELKMKYEMDANIARMFVVVRVNK